MPRKSKARSDDNTPLIRIERATFEEAIFQMNTATITKLEQYAAYVSEVTGEDATTDEIADHGLQKIFAMDKGFQQWLEKQGSAGKRKSAAVKSAEGEQEGDQQAAGDTQAASAS